MPKIFFENECREVECQPGETLREAALRSGVDVNRAAPWIPTFTKDGTCNGLGICGACQVWVKDAPAGAISPPTLRERYLFRMKGWRRLACMVKVQGDIKVITGSAGPDRLINDRPIAAPAGPAVPAPEAPKAEAPKAEAPKAEAPKAEAPKVEAAAREATKVEAPKAEAVAPEAPKAEAPKVDAPAPEAPKADEPKA